MAEWTTPMGTKPRITCATCKHKDFIAIGPRHFDEAMVRQAMAWLENNELPTQTICSNLF